MLHANYIQKNLPFAAGNFPWEVPFAGDSSSFSNENTNNNSIEHALKGINQNKPHETTIETSANSQSCCRHNLHH